MDLCCDIDDVFSSPSRPFIIDLDSTNATFVNDKEIPPSRYYELRAKDGESDVFSSVTSFDK